MSFAICATLRHSGCYMARWIPGRMVGEARRGGRRPRMAATDEHYRAAELAKLWGISPAAVRERFKFEEGVAFLGQHGSAEKRAYTTMLIPASVAERVYASMLSASPARRSPGPSASPSARPSVSSVFQKPAIRAQRAGGGADRTTELSNTKKRGINEIGRASCRER